MTEKNTGGKGDSLTKDVTLKARPEGGEFSRVKASGELGLCRPHEGSARANNEGGRDVRKRLGQECFAGAGRALMSLLEFYSKCSGNPARGNTIRFQLPF